MAGTIVADTLQAAATSTLVIKNGVANTPPTIQDSAGAQIGTFCRAWVAYNGTGTPSIFASNNVSSLSDLGVGQWLVNFTISMPDADYCTVATCNEVDNATICQARLPATSNIAIDVYTSPSGLSNSRADPSKVNVAIFR
jgi:hypothetical protein